MASLTKTEREVLAHAASRSHGSLYAQVWRSSGWRRSGSRGTRAANAIVSLVEKGLAERLNIESSQGPTSDGWATIYSMEYSAKITDAGRAALGV